MQKYNIAVVGATGAVGREMLTLLAERQFPYEQVYAVASRRSIGKEVSLGEDDILKVESLESFDFSKVDIALFSAGSQISKAFGPQATAKGCFVIDNSSAFRMEQNIPLIVPEVNLGNLEQHKLIANPNCVVIPLTMALKPLLSLSPIKRVVVSTYQSVSGAGKKAMDELFNQTRAMMMYNQSENKVFPKQIAFNIQPKIGSFLDNGNTDEEQKIIEETNKILGTNIAISSTCVRVPVFVGHSISANIEFENKIELNEAIEILSQSEGIEVNNTDFLTPTEIVREDQVAICRIRRDYSVANGINMWIMGDNLRKGAALNAIQIAEALIKEEVN